MRLAVWDSHPINIHSALGQEKVFASNFSHEVCSRSMLPSVLEAVAIWAVTTPTPNCCRLLFRIKFYCSCNSVMQHLEICTETAETLYCKPSTQLGLYSYIIRGFFSTVLTFRNNTLYCNGMLWSAFLGCVQNFYKWQCVAWRCNAKQGDTFRWKCATT